MKLLQCVHYKTYTLMYTSPDSHWETDIHVTMYTYASNKPEATSQRFLNEGHKRLFYWNFAMETRIGENCIIHLPQSDSSRGAIIAHEGVLID